jgi:hypothetical protein
MYIHDFSFTFKMQLVLYRSFITLFFVVGLQDTKAGKILQATAKQRKLPQHDFGTPKV